MVAVWVEAARAARWVVATAKAAVEARPTAKRASVVAVQEVASLEAAGMAAVARAEEAAVWVVGKEAAAPAGQAVRAAQAERRVVAPRAGRWSVPPPRLVRRRLSRPLWRGRRRRREHRRCWRRRRRQ